MVNHEAAGQAGVAWSLDWTHSCKDGTCGPSSRQTVVKLLAISG